VSLDLKTTKEFLRLLFKKGKEIENNKKGKEIKVTQFCK